MGGGIDGWMDRWAGGWVNPIGHKLYPHCHLYTQKDSM